MSEEAFIYEAIRTPRGKQKNGSLNEVKPLNLVVGLIHELRKRNPDLDENLISDVILGCVSPVGDRPGDQLSDRLRPAGHRRGPDRHHRGILPRGRRRLCAAVAAEGGRGMVGRVLREIDCASA